MIWRHSPPSSRFITSSLARSAQLNGATNNKLRSLQDLLTSHDTGWRQPTYLSPDGARSNFLSLEIASGCPRPGKVLRVELETTCSPLVRAPSIPLSFNLAKFSYSPGGVLNVFNCGADSRKGSPYLHSSFTAWTTRVSNPVRSPPLSSTQRQLQTRELLSPPVFLIYPTHSTATPEFHSPLLRSSLTVSKSELWLSHSL